MDIFAREMEHFFAEKRIEVPAHKVQGRNGKLIEPGRLSLSLAAGIFDGDRYSDHRQISRQLAFLKGKAKETEGNSYVRHQDSGKDEPSAVK